MESFRNVLNHLKAAIYIRVSTQWQVDKDSLNVQRRELIAYAQMVLGIQDYEIFEDPGYSAKNTDRPKYQEMMDRLRTGEFSHVLVWKIDRISRNLLDFANMYAELKALGVTFVSKNEQFDTSSAIGEAMLKIILVFAELERQITAERVTAVMLSRANVGDWNGGRVAYGYKHDKETGTFPFRDDEIAVYYKMLDLYEDWQSVLRVTRWLNDNGFRTRNGNLWSTTTVHIILTNPWYMGVYRYNVHNDGKGIKKRESEEWIEIRDHHPAAIDELRFNRIQFLLKRNRRNDGPGSSFTVRKNVHIFAGLLKCGTCGSNMSATQDRPRASGWRPSVYACVDRRKRKGCTNKYVSDVTLGPFIFNFVANILRVRQNGSERTDLAVLERKLLRGDEIFSGVSIDPSSLESLKSAILSGSKEQLYQPPNVFRSADAPLGQKELLENRRRKDEAALSRLQSLFLYGDESIPEKEYIIERHRIMKDLEETNEKLAAMMPDVLEDNTSDEDLQRKASYYIMAEQLLSDRNVDYEKHIRNIDSSIPRNFITTIIDKITISDGKVSEITFQNGLSVKFNYK